MDTNERIIKLIVFGFIVFFVCIVVYNNYDMEAGYQQFSLKLSKNRDKDYIMNEIVMKSHYRNEVVYEETVAKSYFRSEVVYDEIYICNEKTRSKVTLRHPCN
ncbi:hypothetical protein RhiirB3_425562 [Rhizophagus irregularis]|nr:hypothetical protein RhiirB3_425562 [Rhizophagus irregularis]